MKRWIGTIWFFLFTGLLFFSGIRCTPGIQTPDEPAGETSFPDASPSASASASPTVVVRSMGPTPTAAQPSEAKPLENDMDINEKTRTPTASPTEPLTITLVYDNHPFDQQLKSGWGFSALVEYHNQNMLFDTGGDGVTLLENMRALEIDPSKIKHVILSHEHGDHTGGLNTLLEVGARPVVYIPPSFSSSLKRGASRITEVVEVVPGLPIGKSIYTTGETGRSIPEQSLVVRTGSGLVIITGCAHPGIVGIVEQASEMFGEPVRLVLGGFHLKSSTEEEVDAILKEFRRLHVERVAPCHCTGDRAIAMFAAEYGENFLPVGVGSVIVLKDHPENSPKE